LAYAVPAGTEAPIVLDIATSAAAHGQIFKALRRGQSIPLGWALDKEGRGTTDPAAMHVLLPFGGHKGYGIGLLVDVLTGALAGSTAGLGVSQQESDGEGFGQSFFMLAINIRYFVPLEVFTARIDQMIREVHAMPPAEGFKEVLVPGDLERREEEARRRDGVPLYAEDWQAVVDGLAKAGLPVDELAARYGPVDA
jgi:ureidoglycolate dehydrogenase (NAD+)